MNKSVKDHLIEDINYFFELTNEEIYAIDGDKIAEIQLHWLRRRFDELRPRLSLVKKHTDDVGIERIDGVNDIVPALLPHTIYKSYSLKALENRRFADLTRWLGRLTTHDLNGLDLSDCVTIDDWINRLVAQTSLRPQVSSGTSGKISVFPRSTVEERAFAEGMWLKITDGYFDGPSLPLRSGDCTIVMAWPVRSGPHNVPTLLRILREICFGGDQDKVITIGQGHQSADELALAGKLRKAEALGEALTLSPNEEEVRRQLAARAGAMEGALDLFIERAIVAQRGRKVLCGVVGPAMYQFALTCKERGIVAEWDPGSILMSGGGAKGFDLPQDWKETVQAVFPGVWIDGYGMSESTASAHACAAGNLHFYPWGIPYLLDPRTSEALPRQGVQTGRMAMFDLMPETHWGGIITGDKVTLNWDGGCACGRKGPYMLNQIDRYASPDNADDKISCAKTPGAYERLEEFAITQG
ncbi:MAG: hypothetical protein WC284_18860 [Candidimonas sp.]